MLLGLSVVLLAPHGAPAQEAPDDPAPPLNPHVGLADLDPSTVEDAYIGLTIRAELSPYDYVRYELRIRGRTLIASLSKSLVGDYGDLQDIGLLSVDELPRLVRELDDCGIEGATLPHPDLRDDTTAEYQLDIRLGDYQSRIRWPLVANRPGTPFWCASRLIIDTYDAVADPIPFVNLFWDEGEYGELSTTSVPSARLYVDGRDLGLVTPVYALRLEPGVHILRYVNAGLGIDREYDATIVEGHTTRIDVELR